MRFGLVINRNQFEAAYTVEAAGLCRAIAGGLTNTLADITGEEPVTIEKVGRGAFDKPKGLIDKHRREEAEPWPRSSRRTRWPNGSKRRAKPSTGSSRSNSSSAARSTESGR